VTPADFQRRMTELCKGNDISHVAMLGINLVDEALGDNAHSYLPALVDYFNRLSVLKARQSSDVEMQGGAL